MVCVVVSVTASASKDGATLRIAMEQTTDQLANAIRLLYAIDTPTQAKEGAPEAGLKLKLLTRRQHKGTGN